MKQVKYWFGLGIIILFIMYFFSSCNPANILPIEAEEQLGEQMAGSILSQSVEVKDSIILNAVQQISNRLVGNIKGTEYTYKIKVIKGEEVNAFTIPGGNVFVFTGLLKFADKPEQVAAVMAHEIGHVEGKHVTNKIIKELGIQLLFQLITGGDPGILAQVGGVALSTVFDREQEEDADDFALQLLERARIQPQYLAGFFEKLNKEYGGHAKEMEFLMTHPSHESRIEKAKAFKTKGNFTEQEFNLDWEQVKQRVK